MSYVYIVFNTGYIILAVCIVRVSSYSLLLFDPTTGWKEAGRLWNKNTWPTGPSWAEDTTHSVGEKMTDSVCYTRSISLKG